MVVRPGAAGPEAPVVVADVEGDDEQQAEDADGAGDHGGDGHRAEGRRRRGRTCTGRGRCYGLSSPAVRNTERF